MKINIIEFLILSEYWLNTLPCQQFPDRDRPRNVANPIVLQFPFAAFDRKIQVNLR